MSKMPSGSCFQAQCKGLALQTLFLEGEFVLSLGEVAGFDLNDTLVSSKIGAPGASASCLIAKKPPQLCEDTRSQFLTGFSTTERLRTQFALYCYSMMLVGDSTFSFGAEGSAQTGGVA